MDPAFRSSNFCCSEFSSFGGVSPFHRSCGCVAFEWSFCFSSIHAVDSWESGCISRNRPWFRTSVSCRSSSALPGPHHRCLLHSSWMVLSLVHFSWSESSNQRADPVLHHWFVFLLFSSWPTISLAHCLIVSVPFLWPLTWFSWSFCPCLILDVLFVLVCVSWQAKKFLDSLSCSLFAMILF